MDELRIHIIQYWQTWFVSYRCVRLKAGPRSRAILNFFQIRKSYLDKYFNGVAWSYLIPFPTSGTWREIAGIRGWERARDSEGRRNERFIRCTHTRDTRVREASGWYDGVNGVRRILVSFPFARNPRNTLQPPPVPVKLIRMNKFLCTAADALLCFCPRQRLPNWSRFPLRLFFRSCFSLLIGSSRNHKLL